VPLTIDPQPDLELTNAQAERLLGAWQGEPVSCRGIERLKGGMINSVFRLDFDRPPHRAVVKLHGNEADSFEAETRSLEYLRAETSCPVPAVYSQDSSARLIPYAFLLLEHLPGVCLQSVELGGHERADVDRQLAAVLAELHTHQRPHVGGIDADDESVGWADLFSARLADARAQPSVVERLASDVLAVVDEAIDGARSALSGSGRPALVFGDVWDGNLIARRHDGRWVLAGLLDPDLQFADPEFELAYLEVFDASREAFFAAYTTHHPLRPGYEQRRLFYWLHTALVHVGLFGDEFFCDFTARTAAAIGRT
jgi:fructosamine-3-kinase